MVGGACENAVGGGSVARTEVEPDELAVLPAPIQRRQFRAGAAQQVAVGVGGDAGCGDEEGVGRCGVDGEPILAGYGLCVALGEVSDEGWCEGHSVMEYT